MSDDQAEQATRLLTTLLDLGVAPPNLPPPIEALHERWAARGLGNSVTIESPSHPDGWQVTLVTPGWPRQTEHRFEGGSLVNAVRLAMRWLDLKVRDE